MHRILYLLIAAMAALTLPSTSAAQGTIETVVVQIDGTTPFGTHMIGTVVVKRDCSTTNSFRSEASFNGMMNGRPVAFSGTMIERWLGNGSEEIEVLSTDIQGTVNWKPPVRTFTIVQTGPNSVTVEGIPAAISGKLEPPCSGRTAYVVTNAGQGSTQIASLPNTASEAVPPQGPAALPFALTIGLTAGLGAALLIHRKLKAAA
jgi:uncharacterized Zn-binding protein involved in type VI secretion